MTPPIIRPVFAGETTLKGASCSTTIPASRRPACISSRPTPASTSREARPPKTGSTSGFTPARSRARPRSGSSTSTRRSPGPRRPRRSTAQFDAGDIHVAEGSLDRVHGDLQRPPERRADRDGDAHRVRRPGEREGPCAGRPGACGRHRRRLLALRARLDGRRAEWSTFDTLDLVAPKFEAHYSGLARAREDARPAEPRRRRPQPLLAACGRRGRGRSAHRRRSRRRAELRPRQRDPRRACDEARHALPDARQGPRRRAGRDRRRPHDAGRRLRLLGSQGGRPQRLGAARRRLPAGQGGSHRDGRYPAGEGRSIPASTPRLRSSPA